MKLDARAQFILEHATSFIACAARGRGVYEKVECATLAEARAAAERMVDARAVGIYAITGRLGALVENVYPTAPARAPRRSADPGALAR
jgi:hypothetical protein